MKLTIDYADDARFSAQRLRPSKDKILRAVRSERVNVRARGTNDVLLVVYDKGIQFERWHAVSQRIVGNRAGNARRGAAREEC